MAIHLSLEVFYGDALLLSLRDERHLVSGGTCHGQLHLVASDRAFVDDGAVLDGDLEGDLLAVQRALLNPALVFPDGDLAATGEAVSIVWVLSTAPICESIVPFQTPTTFTSAGGTSDAKTLQNTAGVTTRSRFPNAICSVLCFRAIAIGHRHPGEARSSTILGRADPLTAPACEDYSLIEYYAI